jgi:hypothetical protein
MSNMTGKPRTIALAFLCTLLLLARPLHAETKPYQPTSPKPPLLLSAKTVFISNDTDAWLADSDKIFDEIYSSIQNQGRFTIAPDPADADLVLQYSFSYAGGAPNSVTLRVLDRKTLVILWSVTGEGTVAAVNGGHGKKNQPDIIDEINDYLKIISTPQPSTN